MIKDWESRVGVVKCERKNQLQSMIQEAEWAALGTSWIDVRKGENDRDISCTEILNQHTTASPMACVRKADSWVPSTQNLMWWV